MSSVAGLKSSVAELSICSVAELGICSVAKLSICSVTELSIAIGSVTIKKK
jgi:hypothetical protein